MPFLIFTITPLLLQPVFCTRTRNLRGPNHSCTRINLVCFLRLGYSGLAGTTVAASSVPPNHSTAIFSAVLRINQRPATPDRLPGHSQLYAEDPTVLWTLRIDSPISRLRVPKGSYRQIIYFIGEFQYLEDLKLTYNSGGVQNEPVGGLTRIPPFVPPLRGSLMMRCVASVPLLKAMVDLFGGI